MHPILLPIILLTTVTLSSSNVLPILAINKLDTEPPIDDQNTDNTFKHKVNPAIFYKVFIGTPKDNLPKKSQLSRLKTFDNDIDQILAIFEDVDNDENSEGFRKEQWHNYPRQLDRLNKNINEHSEKPRDDIDIEKWEPAKKRDEVDENNHEDILERYDSGVLDGPLFILKIRLAYLTNNMNQEKYKKYLPSDILLHLLNRKNEETDDLGEYNSVSPSEVASVTKTKRKEMPREDSQLAEKALTENKAIKKRIFSLWSRLQSLSHRGHELQHRRHLYAFYGLPEDGGGTLTAETRATFMRPPGSPLRWG
ncbi:unnamed protein product [Danaus chrysippus]|uniref:(African queen) hypothetical protein n=1 Tax=Danaus chrysippus TaxID=151541 RepID=A0A8J2R3N6_9NEOP|nr:unnamed protein product [Danaus chrysippus]